MRDLRALPKAELHVHLQGSIRPATVLELAGSNGIQPPPSLGPDGYRFEDFSDFIRQYISTCAVLRRREDFVRIGYEFCADAAAQGIRYAEVTFTPFGQDVDGNADAAVLAVLEGFAEGERDHSVRCRLVLDCVRGLAEECAEPTLDLAVRHREDGVVGFGLGGDESQPGAPFADVFRRARDEGLRSVPHAGEAAGPSSIREALDLLGAERIGHGFRVLDDPDLLNEVRERRIPLEVCPSSNVATGLVASLDVHPLLDLIDAGLVVTLNSDDPAMFGSGLLDEYEAARRIFGLDDAALADLARAGVHASFGDDEMKADLDDEIDGWLKEER